MVKQHYQENQPMCVCQCVSTMPRKEFGKHMVQETQEAQNP